MLIVLCILPVNEPIAPLRFLGRLHPLVLHFPISLILIAFLFEILNRRKGDNSLEEPASILLNIGALTAAISAIAGAFLASEGGYSGNSFLFHKWFGLATSLTTLLIIRLKQNKLKQQLLLPLYTTSAILLIITGHYGATLTHGEDFLTEVFTKEKSLNLELDKPIFSQVVSPILEIKCVSCHNPNKLKGELLLDSQEGILKGGESGQVLIPGDLENSKLISYLLLPTEDKLHMPPKGKSQPTIDELKLLSWWVKNSASFTDNVSQINTQDPIQKVLNTYFAPDEALDIDFVDADLLASINSENLSIKQIEENKPYLEVYIGQNKELKSDDLKPLRKVKEQIYSVDLGGSYIDKSVLKEVAKYKNLHKLYLDNTELDDNALAAIRKLEYLEYLNIYGTNATKRGADQMLKLPKLKKLFLWQTDINPQELAELQESYPAVSIDAGLPADSDFTRAQLIAPKLNFESPFFTSELEVEIPYTFSGSEVVYQIDANSPKPVKNGVVTIKSSSKLSVFAKKEGWEDSPITEQVFIKTTNNPALKPILKHKPKGEYKGEGVTTLFDLKKGSENFRDGNWLGFNGDDLIVDIELERSNDIGSVFISTLDDIGSWIFPPKSMEVWGGQAPDELIKLSEQQFDTVEGPLPKNMEIHQLKFETQSLKHLRIRVKNYGMLPEWHPGKNTPAWLFIDEIALQ